jgi:hypothetical protein
VQKIVKSIRLRRATIERIRQTGKTFQDFDETAVLEKLCGLRIT